MAAEILIRLLTGEAIPAKERLQRLEVTERAAASTACGEQQCANWPDDKLAWELGPVGFNDGAISFEVEPG